MRFASIGTPAALQSSRCSLDKRRAGFTLLEALVALALVSTFVGVLGPYLYQARRIAAHSDRRVAADVLLRSLLETPFDRSSLANAARHGEIDGLLWQVATEPLFIGASGADWRAYRVMASVSWAPRQRVSAETVRLGKVE